MDYGYKTENQEYQKWLIQQLVEHSPKVTTDFRLRELSHDLIPERFRDKRTSPDIIGLYKWILKQGSYDEGVQALAVNEGTFITPKMDGYSHINVYSKGQTRLGKALSNFAPFKFIHPVDGECESVEGYYYYLATGRKYPHLKKLWGYEAKKEGKKYERVEVEDFLDLIKQAITCKIEQNDKLKNALKQSNLPLTHYFFYGEIDNCKVIPDKDPWLTDHLEQIRKALQSQE